MAAHAITSGMMDAIQGNFGGSAFASGLVSSLVASGVQGLGSIKGADGIKFVDQKPNLLKAIMITSGGLSGGISSVIAGGNFMDGFRQGIITSGLNHVAHIGATAIGRVKLRNQIKERIIEKCGEDYLNQPVTVGTLQDLAEIFPEMFGESAKNYDFANQSNIWGGLEIEDGNLYSDGREVSGVANMFSGNVLFSPNFLGTKDILKFTGTWYHETIHSIHAVNGFFTNTFKQFMKNGYGYNDAVRSATYVSETIAHLQTRNYGIGLSFGTRLPPTAQNLTTISNFSKNSILIAYNFYKTQYENSYCVFLNQKDY